MSNAMETIKGRDCQAGKWYELDSGERMLCLGPNNENRSCAFVRSDYYVLNYQGSEFKPLPDCTGWDWKPEPKYRPFKDAWEFVRAVDGRRLVVDGRERWISSVDFSVNAALVVRFGPEWLSLQCVLDSVKFFDTGEPCGVKL
jgi:hypothetical protein